MGVYDAAANEGQGEFDTISLQGNVHGEFKFKAAAAVGDKVYFALYDAVVVRVTKLIGIVCLQVLQ